VKKKVIALIPARSGSKRIPHKNIKTLKGHPLIAYTIRAAIDSGIFDAVVCATDSADYAKIAAHFGAEVPFLREESISSDTSPDIEWVSWILKILESQGRSYDIFSILRPTNPFRKAETIQRAWKKFISDEKADSLRAIEKCGQHPGKMWIVRNERMLPIMPFYLNDTPWHSCQYAALPQVFVQNASLEFAWSRVISEKKSISGEIIIPFESEDLEGFDLNSPVDWTLAEYYASTAANLLPLINVQKN